MADIKIEKIRMEDNRWAERHVQEDVDCNSGEGERVIELYIEDPQPKPLRQRITEKIRNEVYERVIDDIGENGEVVDRRVESVEPATSRMQLVERSVLNPDSAAQDDCDCNITKEEMVDMFVSAVTAVRHIQPAPVPAEASVTVPAPHSHAPVPVPLQHQVAHKLADEGKGNNLFTWLLGAVIAAEAAVLIYVWFWM